MIIIVMGLPGTGKSTVIEQISQLIKIDRIISSDNLRHEIFSHYYDSGSHSQLYQSEFVQIVYNLINLILSKYISTEENVVIEATYHLKERRNALQSVLDDRGIPYLFLVLEATDEIIESRMTEERKDHSEADFNVYYQLKAELEAPPNKSPYYWISTDQSLNKTTKQIKKILIENPDIE